MESIAALFDWVVAGPVTLFDFAKRFPVPFIVSFLVCLFVAFKFCEHEEGAKKAGYTLVGTYLMLIIGWFIASKLGHFGPVPDVQQVPKRI